MKNIILSKDPLKICIILLSILLFLGTNHTQAQSPTLIAEKTKASTVLIVIEDAKGQSSQGSGFFIGNGLVATNYHVVNGAKVGTVKLVRSNSNTQQKRYPIEGVVATDKEKDLAIVKVIGLYAFPLPLGNSDHVKDGQIVYAVGNPRGFEGTFSSGEISNILSNGTPRIKGKVLQFTAAISRGSSGGAVVNQWGQVIGIVSETRDDGQNLNFAIPVNALKSLMEEIGPVRPFPSEPTSHRSKKQLPYPLLLIVMSAAVFGVIWFIPTVKLEKWSTAAWIALAIGNIKTWLTAIARSESFPAGLKAFLDIQPPNSIGHALECDECILELVAYGVKFPAYVLFIAFLLGITNLAVKTFELNGFFSTFFVALLIVIAEMILQMLLIGV